MCSVGIRADVAAAHPAEGIGRAVVQVQPVGLTQDWIPVPGHQVQVAVPVHVAQRHRPRIVGIRADVAAAHPAEGIRRAVVQVQPVGFIVVPGHQVQVAVPVHVPQRQRQSMVSVGADVAATHPAEGAGRAVVQVQPVGLIIVPGHQVEVAVPVHIAQRHGVCIVDIRADVAAAHPAEGVGRAVVQVQPVGLILVPGHQVEVAVPVHVPQAPPTMCSRYRR